MHVSRAGSKFVFWFAVSAAVVSCAVPPGPSLTPSPGQSAGFPLGPVPGNSVSAPLPTDAPAAVRSLAPLPSCGGEVLFEQDVDISPIPTAPGPTSEASSNLQGNNCLIAAWQNGLAAELDISLISDEADEIYSMYRLPGDGTVQLVVRVRSHTDKTILWTETICRQLSVQDGTLTPADCASEVPLG
jgi:hypothetical protein